MAIEITPEYEFRDVLEMFPILKKTLQDDLHFKISEIHEGETMEHFFERKSLSPSEVKIVLRKLNQKVHLFMKQDTNSAIKQATDIQVNYEEE